MTYKGQLFLVVGNSGSGKDTLLRMALSKWPADREPIRSPKRYITRAPHDSEPYISVTFEEFMALKRRNYFWLTWHIYDTDYGVPATVLDWLQSGSCVIVNVSRTIIPEARTKVPSLKVIFISVPYELTLQRLRSRCREREDESSFQCRLERAKLNQMLEDADFVVENSGSPDISVAKLRRYLLSFG